MAEEVKSKIRVFDLTGGKSKEVLCRTVGLDAASIVYIIERYVGKLFDKEVKRKKSLVGGLEKSPVPESKE